MIAGRWVDRMAAHDRGILARCAIDADCSALVRWSWIAVTQLGSAPVTIGLVLLPAWLGLWPASVSWRAGMALAMSHLAVQLVKRSVHRPRPAALPLIVCPDRFSFPSGHATASLAIAASLALAFPAFGVPLVGVGLLVGWSRIVLGVHYPGDVIAGQLIAVITVIAVHATT